MTRLAAAAPDPTEMPPYTPTQRSSAPFLILLTVAVVLTVLFVDTCYPRDVYAQGMDAGVSDAVASASVSSMPAVAPPDAVIVRAEEAVATWQKGLAAFIGILGAVSATCTTVGYLLLAIGGQSGQSMGERLLQFGFRLHGAAERAQGRTPAPAEPAQAATSTEGRPLLPTIPDAEESASITDTSLSLRKPPPSPLPSDEAPTPIPGTAMVLDVKPTPKPPLPSSRPSLPSHFLSVPVIPTTPTRTGKGRHP